MTCPPKGCFQIDFPAAWGCIVQGNRKGKRIEKVIHGIDDGFKIPRVFGIRKTPG
jgi:hypothetical protein